MNSDSLNFHEKIDTDGLKTKLEGLIANIRKGDKLLRDFEKSSKILTQHIQTSIISFHYDENK